MTTEDKSVHIEIQCFKCDTLLGYYEVPDRLSLYGLPNPAWLLCKNCLEKKDKETEELK